MMTRGVAVAVAAILLVPDPGTRPPGPPTGTPFQWNQTEVWLALEARFRRARAVGCEQLHASIASGLDTTHALLTEVASRPVDPGATLLDRLEVSMFELAPVVGACPERLPEFVELVTRMRSVVKRQSEHWQGKPARDRLYRLLFGGRAALEEVMLQAPEGSIPSLVPGDEEPSQTPSTTVLGVRIHSGDLLVSRGGNSTSALIAVGSDYAGNFSHVALVHVDETTAVPTIVEATQRGLRTVPMSVYLDDVKLRIMVLRVRGDLPALTADPMLPHRAARAMLARAKQGRVPYDFSMDHRDDSRMYCSEVPAGAYARFGIRLWQNLSRISGPGTRLWLAGLGAKHFDTMEPSDLEYDPQLRVVAEWRDPEALYLDHVDNVVTEALLDGAARGDRLQPPWWVHPVVRALKAYSVVTSAVGADGPVPDGMSAPAAARFVELDRRHQAIRTRVLELAEAFEREHGYRPPEWQLGFMAKRARDEM